ncbi:uncharacterized protein LOC143576484 isoform X2 [Bidens hawaiensis]|uniref:uncharacterized protein LOC143576484 isoform X2 n=2 Tax=Bidens hawaiensis TaxID=980011 RepID=UPI00404B983F
MAKPKQLWTSNEVKALTDGVKRHGEGKWKVILNDPLFRTSLSNRSNVDLKDKWRNLSGSKHVGSSEKRKAPAYEKMIYEALLAFRDPNGTDLYSIDRYLQVRILTGELEKVNERYRVKRRETSQKGDHAGPQNRIELQQPLEAQNINQRRVLDFDLNEFPEEPVEPVPIERVEDAPSAAAAQIPTAEPLESRAIKGYEDKNMLAGLVDESVSMLRRAEDLYDQCKPPYITFNYKFLKFSCLKYDRICLMSQAEEMGRLCCLLKSATVCMVASSGDRDHDLVGLG